MRRKLAELQPERVFYYFEEICGIPHGSGNTAQISAYCVDFAKKHGLECVQDSLGNVIIKKKASAGYEEHPPVIIQGHLDMVCEKAADYAIDFDRDGLNVDVDGDWVFAHGTSLGGDDGIAVAMALAILESDDLAHPPLEILFTIDEETGMDGAAGLDGGALDGRLLINIDSEDEGVLTVSCAGGIRAKLSIPIEWQENDWPCYTVTVSGLRGGHSGVEINKGRLNSNVVMGSFLRELDEFRIVQIDGGLKDNAIPLLTTCVVSTPCDIASVATAYEREHRVPTDPDLTITIEPTEVLNQTFTTASSRRMVDFLTSAPNGIISWSRDIKGLVQTSLNLGVLKTESDHVIASFALRSSVNEEKMELLNRLREVAAAYGGMCVDSGSYPAWEYQNNSRLRDTMCAVWRDLHGKQPQIIAIHAGLECGFLCEKLSGLDAVSIGPNMRDIHTCRERLSVSSVARIYDYVCEILKAL